MSDVILSIKDLKVSYGGIEAVKGISFDVRQGEIVTLIGANGAGKSSTLRAISGLVKPSGGSISFEGQDITGKNPTDIVKQGVTLVPEGRRIFADLTVLENLRIGAYLRHDDLKDDIEWVYSLFPRLKERSWQAGGTLSGGEQQMLAVGRALMGRPKMILMDEPSMGLSPLLVKEIFAIIREVNKQGITILLVDSLAARKLCVSWVGIGGIIGGFAGIAVVVVGSISGGNADPIGIALLLLADIVWSVGTVYLKYQSISASVQVQIFYQSAIPAILFFFCAVLTGNFDLGKLSWRGALPMAYMGIADSIVGLTSYLYLLRRWKTSVVSTYAYINPVVGILLSALLLSEEITMAKVGGMLLILVSVFVIQREDWLSGLLTRRVKRIAD